MKQKDISAITKICNAWVNDDWVELPIHIHQDDDLSGFLLALNSLRLKLFALQTAESENQTKLTDLVEQQHDANIILEAGKLLTSTINMNDLLHAIMDMIKDMFSLADGVAIFLYDNDKNLFNGVATYGFPDYDNAPWGIDMGAPGLVFTSRQPLLANTPEQVAYLYSTMYGVPKDLLENLNKKRPPLQSILCVPFITRDRPIGVIQLVHWRDGEVFTLRDQNFLMQLADQIAIALDNGLLWEELEKKEQRLQGMVTELINAQEAERKRIARRLHDDTSQDLSTVAIGLTSLVNSLPEDLSEVREKIRKQITVVKDIIHKMRDLTFAIRPAVLDDLGLPAAIKWYTSSITGSQSPVFLLNLEDMDKHLDQTISIALFRVSQEAILNALKYSQASEIRIELMEHAGTVSLIIADNGIGFDYREIIKNHPASFGLNGIKERISLINGSLDIRSSRDNGTEIEIRVPKRLCSERG